MVSLGLLLAGHWLYAHHEVGRRVSKTLWGLNIRHYSKLASQIRPESPIPQEESTETAAPGVAPPTGFYPDPLEFEGTGASPDAELHYTLDGSVPTRRDRRLEEGALATSTTVVRVKAFEPGRLPSETVTRTYFVGETAGLPVVSLVLDPVYLFDKHAGIYANPRRRGRAWERPLTFTILSPLSGRMLEAEGRLRIHGGASRRGSRKKSFRLYLGPEAGDLRAWFGPDAERISANQSEWVLRFASNPRQIHRDRLGQRIASQMGLITSPIVPCVLYLNGRRFGVYDLMERVNPELLAGRLPLGSFSLLRGSMLNPQVASGSAASWRDLWAFVESNDLRDATAFRRVEQALDLDNFMDFWILQIFSGDIDRPDSNMDLYRSETEGGRWSFLVWDFDAGFNPSGLFVDHDTIAWHLRDRVRPDLTLQGSPDSERSVRATVLFRKLMTNPGFRDSFRRRFSELLGGVLSSKRLNETFDELLATYAGVREIELERFPDDPPGLAALHYDEQIAQIRDFLDRRPAVLERLLGEYLSTNGHSTGSSR